jgi:5-hydroxyisourate hydrolase
MIVAAHEPAVTDDGPAFREPEKGREGAMGRLTTHVLDTAHGRPGAGMRVRIYRDDGAAYVLVKETATNADGRCDAPLLEGGAFAAGRYRLVFSAGSYFAAQGVRVPEPAFVDEVTLDFGVADAGAHYHVPLLVSPFSYSTYRGS